MKRFVLGILCIFLLISSISCSSKPSDTDWGNPEEFVAYDVAQFVANAQANNIESLTKEYGEELTAVGQIIYMSYSKFGLNPKVLRQDRFADGCWLVLTGVLGEKKPDGLIYDETQFYYIYRHDRWQLAKITIETYVKGNLVKDSTIVKKRDIPFK